MKRLVKAIFLILIGVVCSIDMALAKETAAEPNTLIEVNVGTNINTEHFSYQNVSFNKIVNDKGYSNINFGSIVNKSDSSMPVSVSIGLFDSDKKNIGTLNYCSKNDLDTEYSGKVLKKNESTAYYMVINPEKHLIDKKEIKDIAYIAVINDNKYCKVGGKDNYVGETLEEITAGKTADQVEQHTIDDVIKYIEEFDTAKIDSDFIIKIVVILVLYIIQSKILDALNKQMFSRKSSLAWLPIGNIYLALKLAFGPLIGIVGLLLSLLFIWLGLKSTGLLYLVGIILIVGDIVVIIKLITKNYNLFYLENILKARKNDRFMESSSTTNNNNRDVYNRQDNSNSFDSLIESYNNSNNNQNSAVTNNNNNNNTSQQNNNRQNNNFFNNINNNGNQNNNGNNNNNNNDDGGSDLRKFFG